MRQLTPTDDYEVPFSPGGQELQDGDSHSAQWAAQAVENLMRQNTVSFSETKPLYDFYIWWEFPLGAPWNAVENYYLRGSVVRLAWIFRGLAASAGPEHTALLIFEGN